MGIVKTEFEHKPAFTDSVKVWPKEVITCTGLGVSEPRSCCEYVGGASVAPAQKEITLVFAS